LGEDEFIDQIERIETSAEPALFAIPLADIAKEVVNHMAIGRDRMYFFESGSEGSVWAGYRWLFGEEIDGFISQGHCPAFSKGADDD